MVTKHLGIKLQEVIDSLLCLAREFGLYMETKKRNLECYLVAVWRVSSDRERKKIGGHISLLKSSRKVIIKT